MWTIINLTAIRANGSPTTTQISGTGKDATWAAARRTIKDWMTDLDAEYAGPIVRVFAHDTDNTDTEEWKPRNFVEGDGYADHVHTCPKR